MEKRMIDQNQRIPAVESELLHQVERYVDARDEGALRRILTDLHPVDLAGLLEYLDEEARHTLLGLVGDDLVGETVLHLPEEQREEYLEGVTAEKIAAIVEDLDPDDATDIVAELSEEMAEDVLRRLGERDEETSEEIRALLQYGEETAGGRMTLDYVAVLPTDSVAQAIEKVREEVADSGLDLYVLYVVDNEGELLAYVRLQDLVLHSNSDLIARLMIADVTAIAAEEDQELVAQLMQRYDLVQIPVVDEGNRLLGVVTFDDIAEIIEEEASEDILYLAGVTDDQESPSTPPLISIRRRLPWLVMNLGTAFIAAMVVAQFEGTIARITALAALMPLVAGMGGNAAVQSIAVMVRSMALGELGSEGRNRAIVKEGTVGLMNGTAIGLLAGGVVWAMWGDMRLGLLIAIAMFVNLIVAGLVGTVVPLLLRKLKFDPALSSGPLATTFTDVCGFLTFLGLATVTIDWLLG